MGRELLLSWLFLPMFNESSCSHLWEWLLFFPPFVYGTKLPFSSITISIVSTILCLSYIAIVSIVIIPSFPSKFILLKRLQPWLQAQMGGLREILHFRCVPGFVNNVHDVASADRALAEFAVDIDDAGLNCYCFIWFSVDCLYWNRNLRDSTFCRYASILATCLKVNPLIFSLQVSQNTASLSL